MKRAVVAGGGVLGTWHALELCQAGFTVTHLEAEVAPQGASVRNFGLVWVSGRRTGAELDIAQRARQRWEEIGTDVPAVGFRAVRSLTLASTDGERKVMEEFAAHPDAAARSITYVDPEEVAALNPAVHGDIVGGLHCGKDAIVEPATPLEHFGTTRPRCSYTYQSGRRWSPWRTMPSSTPRAPAGKAI